MGSFDLRRIGELRDHSIALKSPKAYFQADDTKLSDPAKRRFFVDIEGDLQGLDAQAWTSLKGEALPRLKARALGRGHEELFSILNQARAYNYLTGIGCSAVQFVPRSKGRTPDLRAILGSVLVLCEVKTIHVSAREVERRESGGVSTTFAHVDLEFIGKLRRNIDDARAQMAAFDDDPAARRIVYVVVNFDDPFHEYEPDYRADMEADLAATPPAGVEIVLDIKPPFYAAT